MAILAFDTDSPSNTVENEVFFLIDLVGIGYLTQDSDWEERIQNQVYIDDCNFGGQPALFDEIPLGIIESINPYIRPNIRVRRRFSVHLIEEVVI